MATWSAGVGVVMVKPCIGRIVEPPTNKVSASFQRGPVGLNTEQLTGFGFDRIWGNDYKIFFEDVIVYNSHLQSISFNLKSVVIL